MRHLQGVACTLAGDVELKVWLRHGQVMLGCLVHTLWPLSGNSCCFISDVHPRLPYSMRRGTQHAFPRRDLLGLTACLLLHCLVLPATCSANDTGRVTSVHRQQAY